MVDVSLTKLSYLLIFLTFANIEILPTHTFLRRSTQKVGDAECLF